MTQFDGQAVTLMPFDPENCNDVPILVEALADAAKAEATEVCEHLKLLGLRGFLDEYVLI